MKPRTPTAYNTRTRESRGTLKTWRKLLGALALSILAAGSLTFADDVISEGVDTIRAGLATGITPCQLGADRPRPTRRSDVLVTANNQCMNVGLNSDGSPRIQRAMHVSVYLVASSGVVRGTFTEDFFATP